MAHAHHLQRHGPHSVRRAIGARMSGPGGLYNLGNLIGLASGIVFAILTARSAGVQANAGEIALVTLAGSPGAFALSVAMVIFFVSGEHYHRSHVAATPDSAAHHLRRADFLSGVAALFLAVSLFCFGDYWLAVTSTVLLAGGKFANAALSHETGRVRVEYLGLGGVTSARSFDVFRVVVMLSRAPAIAGLLLALAANWPDLALLQDGPTAMLLGCFLLWLKADMLLARD